MGTPRKTILYFLTDKNNSFYSLQNNAIVKNAVPVPINDNPIGWQDLTIAFGTNNKYWSLNRSFTIPLTFVNDGADILRYLIYKGAGYEEEVNLSILKLNPDTGIYELEFKGKLDFTKLKDDPTKGVTVNVIEGGLLSFLNANDSTTYELQCNETNPDAVKVQFDGVTLFDRYKYSFLDLEIELPTHASGFTIPASYLSNEGDSVGIITGSPTFEETGDVPTYVTSSSNYFFSSATKGSFPITGKLVFQKTAGDVEQIIITLNSSTGQRLSLFNQSITSTGEFFTVDLTQTLTCEPDEKWFLICLAFGDIKIKFTESFFYVSSTTINPPSISFALPPLQLGKQLLSKMTNGRYTMESNFFASHNNIVAAGGEAIRGLSNAVLKTSFQDYFNSYNAIYNLGVKVVNDVLWIELKADLYNDATDLFDVGEVTDFSIGYAEEYLVNSLKIGYPVQNYDERNGRFEFNDTIEEKLPVTAVNKELNLVSKYRGDSYGIEFNRGKLNNKDTTDNAGDNEVFLINVDSSSVTSEILLSLSKGAQDNISGSVAYDNVVQTQGGSESFIAVNVLKTEFTYINATPQTVRIAVNFYGTKGNTEPVFSIMINNVAVSYQLIEYFQTTFRVSITITPTLKLNDKVSINISTPVTLNSAGIDFQVIAVNPISIFSLRRVTYDSLTGVLTDTVYNIEEMTPKRMLLAHGNYLRSLLYQLPGEKITFQTADKNKDLSTTLAGVTITESADVVVGSLPDPLFLPFEITFKTKVPFSFPKIMSMLSAGHVKATYNYYPLYFLPIGDMKCKPVTDEAQEWKLLASPLNSLDTLIQLSQGAVIISDYMQNQLIISDLNPVHFNRYDYKTPAKYHFKGIYDDRFEGRISRYHDKAIYYQKWQVTDLINLQFITVGYGVLNLQVFNGEMLQVSETNSTVIPDTSLQSPYVKQQFSIDLSTFAEGIYQFVLSVTGKRIAISEWQNVVNDMPDTLLIEYSDTKNKPDAYFKEWTPAIRVEGFMPPPTPESASFTYEDEPGDTELLNGTSYMKQKVLLGDGYGLPDFMAKKINRLLNLNRVFIEGVEYTKDGDAKLEPSAELTGYPMVYYTIDMRESVNEMALVLSDLDLGNSFASTLTLDAESFGGAPGVIQIEVN